MVKKKKQDQDEEEKIEEGIEQVEDVQEPPTPKPEPKYEGIIIKTTRNKKGKEQIFKNNIDNKTSKYPYINTDNDFKKLIKLLNGVRDEHTLKFTEKNLTVSTVDEAHVSLFNINIDYNHPMFKEMEIPYPMELTLDTKVMSDVLKAFSSNITLIPKDNQITVKDDVKTYRFSTLINENHNPHIPDIDKNLKTHIKLGVDKFKNLVRDCNRISEHIRFETKNDGVRVSAENDSNVVFFETILPHRDIEKIGDVKGKSMFSLDMLTKIFGIEEFTGEIELHYGTDMPIKIMSDIKKSEGYNKPTKTVGEICYMVAPRIESE